MWESQSQGVFIMYSHLRLLCCPRFGWIQGRVRHNFLPSCYLSSDTDSDQEWQRYREAAVSAADILKQSAFPPLSQGSSQDQSQGYVEPNQKKKKKKKIRSENNIQEKIIDPAECDQICKDLPQLVSANGQQERQDSSHRQNSVLPGAVKKKKKKKKELWFCSANSRWLWWKLKENLMTVVAADEGKLICKASVLKAQWPERLIKWLPVLLASPRKVTLFSSHSSYPCCCLCRPNLKGLNTVPDLHGRGMQSWLHSSSSAPSHHKTLPEKVYDELNLVYMATGDQLLFLFASL